MKAPRNRIENQRERDIFDSAYEQERESGLSIKDARWMAWEEVFRLRERVDRGEAF